jgi:predicted DNA-binding ribbon-helix-helix protein
MPWCGPSAWFHPSEMAGPRKRSVIIAGHRTSLSLEAQFWDALKCAAETRNTSVSALIAEIDGSRNDINLSSAVRIFLLNEAVKGRLGG